MPKSQIAIIIAFFLIFLLLILNAKIFTSYTKYQQLFSELKNNYQEEELSSHDKDILTPNEIKVVSKKIEDSTLNTVTWSALTSYPAGCAAGQAVQVIGDSLTCFSVWDDINDLPLASPSDNDTKHLSTADQIYDWVTGRGYISNDSSISKDDLENSGTLDFDWSNDEVDDALTINSSGSVTWSALTSYPAGCAAGQAVQVIGDSLTCVDVGSSLWTDGGDTTYLTVTTDDLAVGGTDTTAPFYLDVGSSLLTLTSLTVNNSASFNASGADADFIVAGDNEDNLLRVDAETDAVRLGDWDTNYAQFANDGELTLTGTARVYKNEWLEVGSFRVPGLNPATETEWGIASGWEFTDSAEDVIYVTIRIPQDMDKTVAPELKIGWASNTAGDGAKYIKWQLEYLYRTANEDTTAGAQETLTVNSIASTTANGLTIATITGMDLPSASDQLIMMRITRLGNDDDLGDDCTLIGAGLRYISDKLGVGS